MKRNKSAQKVEVWMKVDKFPSYLVSNLGRICRCLKPFNVGHGYKMIAFGRGNRRYMHRVVAEAFLAKGSPKLFINHKDGDKANNRVSNLEWVTLSENAQHAVKIGLIKTGENHRLAKVSDRTIREIRRLRKSGVSSKELATKFGLKESYVFAVVRRQKRKST